MANDLAWDLRRLGGRIERMRADDRFARNGQTIANIMQHDIVAMTHALDQLKAELPEPEGFFSPDVISGLMSSGLVNSIEDLRAPHGR